MSATRVLNLSLSLLLCQPHKFSQVSSVVSQMSAIAWHMEFCMPPITFNVISACSSFFVDKFLWVIYCYMCVPQLLKFTVGSPAVTVNDWSRLDPFLYDWNQGRFLRDVNWISWISSFCYTFHALQTPIVPRRDDLCGTCTCQICSRLFLLLFHCLLWACCCPLQHICKLRRKIASTQWLFS